MGIAIWMFLLFLAFASIGYFLSGIAEAEQRKEYEEDPERWEREHERLYYL